jgi:16S rRNA C967 or C1407 C5-methylase (RsmB/RsmF family)
MICAIISIYIYDIRIIPVHVPLNPIHRLLGLGDLPHKDAFMVDFPGSAPTLGLTPAHLMGEVYLQELSSMLPAAAPWMAGCG